MAYSTVLRKNIREDDTFYWIEHTFGMVYYGDTFTSLSESEPKFINRIDKFHKDIIFGVLRDGVFHYVKS